jgi:hypothetical protein
MVPKLLEWVSITLPSLWERFAVDDEGGVYHAVKR